MAKNLVFGLRDLCIILAWGREDSCKGLGVVGFRVSMHMLLLGSVFHIHMTFIMSLNRYLCISSYVYAS